MFYRENGQFKTSYRADQQIFAIAQDRWAVLALIAFAFVGVPLFGKARLVGHRARPKVVIVGHSSPVSTRASMP